MTEVKELHIATKLEDLEQHSAIPDVKTKKIPSLLESARKLINAAEQHNRDGDEELAYIFYMKYFNMLNSIHKKPEYSQHKQTVRQFLGGNATNKVTMDKLESLSKSLSKRYEARQNSAKAKVTSNQPIDDRDYNELSASEKFDRLKAGSQVAPISPIDLLSERHMRLITPQELFEHIMDSNVLIMDCRPSADYLMSCLRYAWSLNIPEEIIVAGMSAGKLQDKLDNSSKMLWSSRCIKDYVVLMDWNTKDENPSQNSPIGILLDILQNWDPDATYRSPIKILEGGFEYFIMMYPTLCTNPTVQAPHQNNNDVNIIDDIEYPSIHDITMKDEIRERDFSESQNTKTVMGVPSVDRSSKQAAIETYKTKQKVIVEILQDQEKLLQKAKANDEKLHQASERWVSIFENKKTLAGKVELTPSEQELLYNILQLESVADDYKIENNRLREELENYRRLEREQQERLSPNEAEKLEKVTQNIESKIKERQQLDEKHEREKQQRERQLAIARENKRHLKASPPAEDEGISKPKIPQFDRSVKPLVTSVPTTSTAERLRDFSPVPGTVGRGLTGLKNLGNTCYMNSILQCLSNTPHLAEYCITDKYKEYINRSNKTKGQIVEEVAALIKVLWNGNYKCVASKDLRYVVGQYQQIFRGIEQQDSHEFLTILMDWLHSDLQTLNVPEKPRDNITASEKAWLDFTKSKESLILHLFYGQIKSTVKCVMCNKESATYECFSNLSLELPSNASVCYLNQCMDMYFSGELIHGWNCPSCKQKRDAIKKLDISKLPPVLVVHLKRFYADADLIGQSYRKKQNYVRFPLENMDMTPYIAKSELRSVTPKTYQLYGVSNHYGSMESGHYTAFCKSGNYGKWFKFDDQVVSHLDTSSVVSSAAYILFYTRLPPIQINEIN